MSRFVVTLLLFALSTAAYAQTSAPAKAVVRDGAARRQLLGAHKLSLQCISWKRSPMGPPGDSTQLRPRLRGALNVSYGSPSAVR